MTACRLVGRWPSESEGVPYRDVLEVLALARIQDEDEANALRRARR